MRFTKNDAKILTNALSTLGFDTTFIENALTKSYTSQKEVDDLVDVVTHRVYLMESNNLIPMSLAHEKDIPWRISNARESFVMIMRKAVERLRKDKKRFKFSKELLDQVEEQINTDARKHLEEGTFEGAETVLCWLYGSITNTLASSYVDITSESSTYFTERLKESVDLYYAIKKAIAQNA